MKIIIDKGKKRALHKVNSDTYLFFTGKHTMLSLFYLRHIPKENRMYYLSDNIKNSKLAKKIPIQSENTCEIMFKYIGEIIKRLKTDKEMNLCIFSDNEDERIFFLCDNLKKFSDIVYVITENDAYFEKISQYNMDNYGIMTNRSKPAKADVDIVLNSKKTFFDGEYVINLSKSHIEGNVLYDIVPYGTGDFKGVTIKKCQFLTENCENFNLIWRNYPKSVDKSEI